MSVTVIQMIMLLAKQTRCLLFRERKIIMTANTESIINANLKFWHRKSQSCTTPDSLAGLNGCSAPCFQIQKLHFHSLQFVWMDLQKGGLLG